MTDRRRFMTRSASFGAAFATLPGFWQTVARATEARNDLPLLFVVELDGGNDALNTVVPFRDDVYYRRRPTLAVKVADALKLDDRVGFHPSLKAFKRLFDVGELAVVQNVGYPNPDRSHFRSREIWQAGSVETGPMQGWLGRSTDVRPELVACYLGTGDTPLAVVPRNRAPSAIRTNADYGLSRSVDPSIATTSLSNGTDALADISRRLQAGREFSRFVDSGNLRQLPDLHPDAVDAWASWIKFLLSAKPAPRIFYTRLYGYDSHQNQAEYHGRLLERMADSVGKLIESFRGSEIGKRLAFLVFSEFGRRVEENASGGTDHGTGGAVFLAGQPIRGGLFGQPADLSKLDPLGDPAHGIDFRQVYANVLDRWLGVSSTAILGQNFPGKALELFRTE